MNAKLKKETTALLNKKLPNTEKSRVYHIVDETIVGSAVDNIAEQAGDLMGRLTMLDVEVSPSNPQEKIDQNIAGANKIIFNTLIDETIKQLSEHKI